MLAKQLVYPLGAQHGCLLGVLDAFGDRAQAETAGEAEEVAQKNAISRAVREISDKRAVDLYSIHRQALQVSQRSMPGAEIVERDATAGIAQGVDKPDALLDVIECRGFGDFDHQ